MIEHIAYHPSKKELEVLDQRKLPEREVFLTLTNYEEIARAIENLTVRGAPLIGITAAYGVVVGVWNYVEKGKNPDFYKIKKRFAATRPTAVNLFWALRRMEKVFLENKDKKVDYLVERLEEEAILIHREDIENNKKMGSYGAKVLADKTNILTHCNAGWLATGGWGTAVGVIFSLGEKKKDFHVWVDETRPVLQGARLTAYEMVKMGVNHTVICDNMAGFLMSQGKVDAVIVGADRITSSGDAANKIGSYSLAVLCHYHHIPFYVAAPFSTIDKNIKSGADIPIEERSEDEIKKGLGRLITPVESPVYNPAFDVIPAELITAIITEKGVYYPPYDFSRV